MRHSDVVKRVRTALSKGDHMIEFKQAWVHGEITKMTMSGVSYENGVVVYRFPAI
jgi:hypothetical protein